MNRQLINKVTGRATQDGAGVKLSRILGQPALPRLDPFLLLDEFGSDEAQDYIAGFPEHPHRGFQTVTYMLEGKMEHQDSVGNRGVIETGGAQWMNAGRGIIHSEMPKQNDGRLRGFQLWVNLPSAEKFSAPDYQDLTAEQIPEATISKLTKIRVIAGEYLDVKGAVTTQAVNPSFYDIISDERHDLSFSINPDLNSFVYVYEGNIEIEEESLAKGEIGVLGQGSKVNIRWNHSARFILLAAKPINEPVVQYGPFVMNTKEQIQQAIEDYQSGVLGQA